MSHDQRLYQQSTPRGNIYNINNIVDDRQNENVINQNHNYQNLILDPHHYQLYQDARSSTGQYFSVPPPPPPPPVYPLLFVTPSPNISYDTARDTYTQIMNEKCQAELNRLKIDVRICREILTIQMKMNAILLGRYFR